MHATYSVTHLADSTLIQEILTLAAQDCSTTAALLARVMEFHSRRLYLPAGYPSTFAYCVGELHLSEDATAKRIHAGRAARRFPVLFELLASGELHLTAIRMLAPHLTESNARELIAAARHKTQSQLDELLASRFPRPELPEAVRPVSAATSHQNSQHAVRHVASASALPGASLNFASTPIQASAPMVGRATPSDDAPLAPPAPIEERAKTKPVSADRFALQLTMDRTTHDKLRRAQELLGHPMRPGDLAGLLDRALDALIEKLEKQKFAASSRLRAPRRRDGARVRSSNPRTIPAHVKRAVWQRDHGQCTFVSATGHRCDCRRQLEFDHVEPVARGGLSTVSNLRLRCRAHNPYDAEQVFGVGFMQQKRTQALGRAAEARIRSDRERMTDGLDRPHAAPRAAAPGLAFGAP